MSRAASKQARQAALLTQGSNSNRGLGDGWTSVGAGRLVRLNWPRPSASRFRQFCPEPPFPHPHDWRRGIASVHGHDPRWGNAVHGCGYYFGCHRSSTRSLASLSVPVKRAKGAAGRETGHRGWGVCQGHFDVPGLAGLRDSWASASALVATTRRTLVLAGCPGACDGEVAWGWSSRGSGSPSPRAEDDDTGQTGICTGRVGRSVHRHTSTDHGSGAVAA